jgi:hypothetical protein
MLSRFFHGDGAVVTFVAVAIKTRRGSKPPSKQEGVRVQGKWVGLKHTTFIAAGDDPSYTCTWTRLAGDGRPHAYRHLSSVCRSILLCDGCLDVALSSVNFVINTVNDDWHPQVPG